MVATVPVPISDTVEDPGLECGGEGLLQELPEEENQDERDVLNEPGEDPKPANLPEENKEKDTGEQEHQKLEAEKPMKMQLITMVEPLAAQTRIGFLSGLRRFPGGEGAEDAYEVQREEAAARATVALTRAKELCVILGPSICLVSSVPQQ